MNGHVCCIHYKFPLEKRKLSSDLADLPEEMQALLPFLARLSTLP